MKLRLKYKEKFYFLIKILIEKKNNIIICNIITNLKKYKPNEFNFVSFKCFFMLRFAIMIFLITKIFFIIT